MQFTWDRAKSTAYRVTIDRQRDNGLDYTSSVDQGHDGTQLNRLNFRSITDISNSETLDLQAAFVHGLKEIESVNKYQKTFPDIHVQDYYLNALWQKNISANHEIQLQAYTSSYKNNQQWTTCLPKAMLLPQMFNLWRSNKTYVNTILAGKIPSGGSAQDNALAHPITHKSKSSYYQHVLTSGR